MDCYLHQDNILSKILNLHYYYYIFLSNMLNEFIFHDIYNSSTNLFRNKKRIKVSLTCILSTTESKRRVYYIEYYIYVLFMNTVGFHFPTFRFNINYEIIFCRHRGTAYCLEFMIYISFVGKFHLYSMPRYLRLI